MWVPWPPGACPGAGIVGITRLLWLEWGSFSGNSRECSRSSLEPLSPQDSRFFPRRHLQTQISGKPLLKRNGKKHGLGRTHWLQMTDPYSDPGKVIQLQAQVYSLINPLKDTSVSCFFSLLLLACQHHSYRLGVPTRLKPRAALGSNPT